MGVCKKAESKECPRKKRDDEGVMVEQGELGLGRVLSRRGDPGRTFDADLVQRASVQCQGEAGTVAWVGWLAACGARLWRSRRSFSELTGPAVGQLALFQQKSSRPVHAGRFRTHCLSYFPLTWFLCVQASLQGVIPWRRSGWEGSFKGVAMAETRWLGGLFLHCRQPRPAACKTLQPPKTKAALVVASGRWWHDFPGFGPLPPKMVGHRNEAVCDLDFDNELLAAPVVIGQLKSHFCFL